MINLFVLASMILNGCVQHDNTDIIIIDFISNKTVIANGKEFTLESKEDGGQIIEAFPNVSIVQIRNMQNALFCDIWNIVDYQASKGKMKNNLSYEVILSSGEAKEIKFFGRASDHLLTNRNDVQTPIEVNSNCFFDTKKLQQGLNTYLQIWCEISSARGCDILKIIERYLSHTSYVNDVYLLLYWCKRS